MKYVVIVFGLLSGACVSDDVRYPTRSDQPDAGTPADCSAACDRLRELKCPEGEPTPGGASCEDVCNNAEQSETITLMPSCVMKIGACDGVHDCTYGP